MENTALENAEIREKNKTVFSHLYPLNDWVVLMSLGSGHESHPQGASDNKKTKRKFAVE